MKLRMNKHTTITLTGKELFVSRRLDAESFCVDVILTTDTGSMLTIKMTYEQLRKIEAGLLNTTEDAIDHVVALLKGPRVSECNHPGTVFVDCCDP